MKYLFSVFWKDIRIGLLFSREQHYIFMYDQQGLQRTSEMGFDKLIGFPDTNGIYISRRLFPIFDSRVMSSSRSNISSAQAKINFLIETKGKLVTDNISIRYEEKENVKKRL